MKLLLATDLSECSSAAVESVFAQFVPNETCVRLFHAIDWEQQLPASFLFAEGPNAAKDLLEAKDRIMADVHAHMTELETRFRAAGFSAHIQIEPGEDACRAIVAAARTWQADLVVMGSRGRSGLTRWLLGSVAEGVMRHASCSVQIVRTPSARHLEEGDGVAPAGEVAERTPLSVFEAIYRRRSVRHFTSEIVQESTIRELLRAAVHAPTALHEEPCVFTVVQNVLTLERISDRAKTVALQMLPAATAAGSSPGEAGKMSSLMKRLADPDFNVFYDASTLVVIGARDIGPYVDADCWLAAENLMLAARGLGLGSCCIGFALPALNTREGHADAGLPRDVRAIAAIVIGRPAAEPAPVPRKVPEIAAWIQ